MLPNLILAIVALLLGLPASMPVPTDSGSNSFLPDRALKLQLEDELSGLDGSYGVAVMNLEDGHTVLVNANESFHTASMYKLLVMYRVFQQANDGALSLEDPITITERDLAAADDGEGLAAGDTITIADALEAMITVSSNAAAYALTRTVGGWNEIASAASELGMENTGLEDDFYSTPSDMMHFFDLVASRSMVSPSASAEMLSLLLEQQINDRLPALLPEGTPVAHKTGNLEGICNDGGIVFAPGGRYIVVVMARGVDRNSATQVEAEISRIVYDRYGT